MRRIGKLLVLLILVLCACGTPPTPPPPPPTTTPPADTDAVIAELRVAMSIHEKWLAAIEGGAEVNEVAGDAEWHKHWIAVYEQAIALLEWCEEVSQ